MTTFVPPKFACIPEVHKRPFWVVWKAEILGDSLNIWRWARDRADFQSLGELAPASTDQRVVDIEEFINRRRLVSN